MAGYSGDGGPAISAQLNQPYSIIFDGHGSMFIADELNNVVRKINPAGIISTFAGNTHNGYFGDGGAATSAELSKPTDLVFDDDGNLYVAEYGNGVIRKIDTSGIITTFAGNGMSGYDGDGGPATNAKLNDPLGMIFDKKGNLYFSNNGFRVVRKVSTSGVITTIAGTGIGGYSGDGGPATSAKIRLTGYLAIDDTGNIYIPDYLNHRVRKVDTFGIISTIIGNGLSGNGGDGGPALVANIGNMWSVLLDSTCSMYISDRIDPVIRKVNTSGAISTIAGTGVAGYSGDGGDATSAQFNVEMHCSAIDKWGNLYVADPYNHRIRRITYNTDMITYTSMPGLNAKIYPNPAWDIVNIATEVPIFDLRVVNIIGQTMITLAPFNKSVAATSVSHIPSGVYLIKVNGIYAGKFIKE